MKLKPTALAVAAVTTLAAGSVNAATYARSYLEISNLLITITDTNGNPVFGQGSGNTINSFSFDSTNTARLNGVDAPTRSDTCESTSAPVQTNNNCGSRFWGPGNANEAVLDAAGVFMGTPVTENQFFPALGPGLNEYSMSDSVIHTASLAAPFGEPLGGPTHTEQVAESELQTGTDAAASANIESTTGFTFDFTVGSNTPWDMEFSFDAIWETYAEINTVTGQSATASKSVVFTLQELGGDNTTYTWSQGACSGGAFAGPCTDDGDLVQLINAVVTDKIDDSDQSGDASYAFTFADLTEGDWSLSLVAYTSTTMRNNPVPAPATLALLGLGLGAFGFTGRRRRKQA